MNFIVPFLATIAIVACTPPRTQIEKAIASAVDTCHTEAACEIDIASITDFGWDTLYVFTSVVNIDEIKKITGLQIHSDYEFASRMIFVKDGHLVYKEERPVGFDGSRDGEVIFKIPANASYWQVNRDEAKFLVRREEYRGSIRYMLRVPQVP